MAIEIDGMLLEDDSKSVREIRRIYDNHSRSSNHESRSGDRDWAGLKIVELEVSDPGLGTDA